MATHSRRQREKYDIQENPIDKKNIHGYSDIINTFLFWILFKFKCLFFHYFTCPHHHKDWTLDPGKVYKNY